MTGNVNISQLECEHEQVSKLFLMVCNKVNRKTSNNNISMSKSNITFLLILQHCVN